MTTAPAPSAAKKQVFDFTLPATSASLTSVAAGSEPPAKKAMLKPFNPSSAPAKKLDRDGVSHIRTPSTLASITEDAVAVRTDEIEARGSDALLDALPLKQLDTEISSAASSPASTPLSFRSFVIKEAAAQQNAKPGDVKINL